MLYLNRQDVIERLPYDKLVSGLPERLLKTVRSPQRHVHGWPGEASFLLMPAWNDTVGGVKIVNVTPGNAARGLPAVTASYLVIDAETGEHKALLDGGELTARRTAAVAAVAAARLSDSNAHRLLIAGSGRIATELAFAYRAVRDIRHIAVYSPTEANAWTLIHALRAHGLAADLCANLSEGAAEADIIACGTMSKIPLIKGAWLKPGQHVALIGGYLPDMREADDDCMTNGQVWIDTEAALGEAGDLSAVTRDAVKGTLSDLCAVGEVAGSAEYITVFKSVGDAAQDLAAASLVLD